MQKFQLRTYRNALVLEALRERLKNDSLMLPFNDRWCRAKDTKCYLALLSICRVAGVKQCTEELRPLLV